MKKNSRRSFISVMGVATAGYFILPSSVYSFASPDTNRYIDGWLYDLFGYPVAGASVELVRNYKLDIEYMNVLEPIRVSSTITDNKGQFRLNFDTAKNPNDIGVVFKVNGVVRPINSFGLTNTNIPFPLQEIYSSNSSKWLKDIFPVYIGLNEGANFYIDTSRQLVQNYTKVKNAGLIEKLHSAEYKYHGDHTDPENYNNCLGEWDWRGDCDDHWHYPETYSPNRKISIPWGKTDRRVIPFVVCEGQLYWVESKNYDDYDRIFRMIINPAYKHISNPINQSVYCNEGQVDGELCLWFINFTNIKRNHQTSDLANVFKIPANDICRQYVYDKKAVFRETNGIPFKVADTCSRSPVRKESDCTTRRVWMLGTWCADTAHDVNGHHYNEIHPVYWVVPFFGAWERFHLFQYYVMTDLVIRPDYFDRFKTKALLQNLKEFVIALIGSSKKNYSKYVVHLHQYGLDILQKEEKDAGIDDLSSTDILTIDFWAQKQSIATLTAILKKKLQKVFELLTNLGSGFLLYPCMFYCYEMVEIKKRRNFSSRIDKNLYVKEALAKSDNYDSFITLKNDMILSYELCFDELYLKMRNNPGVIAEFYAQSSMRYITQGLFIREFILDEPANSIKYQDHYNLALEKLNAGSVQPLRDLMRRRIETFWWEALPFVREK